VVEQVLKIMNKISFFSQVVLALLPPPPKQLGPIVKKVAEYKELDACKLAAVLVR